MSAARHEAVLRRLANQGSLGGGECSKGLLGFLSPLITGGVLEWEKMGGGKRLVVRSGESLSGFLSSKYPISAENAKSLERRTQGVARFRDSKALEGTGMEIVCLRAWGAPQLWRDGQPVDVVSLTKEHGVAAILVGQEARYRLSGTVAFVENPAAFRGWEKLGTAAGLVIYYQGKISRRLLNWVCTQEGQDFHLLHGPDYDPAGLADYLRLKERLDVRVSLHLPVDLRARFLKFSKRSLLSGKRSTDILRLVRTSTQSEVRAVVKLINLCTAGLEQEALLFDLPGKT